MFIQYVDAAVLKHQFIDSKPSVLDQLVKKMATLDWEALISKLPL